jgi:hypothetical protein
LYVALKFLRARPEQRGNLAGSLWWNGRHRDQRASGGSSPAAQEDTLENKKRVRLGEVDKSGPSFSSVPGMQPDDTDKPLLGEKQRKEYELAHNP